MPTTRFRVDGGFTLVELVVAVALFGILIAVAIPTFMVNLRQARDMDTKLAVTTGARVVAALEPALGGYPDDPVLLEAAAPGAGFGGVEPGPLRVIGGDVEAGDRGQVLLYSRSLTGRWFGLRLVLSGPEAGRHTCLGSESDMQLATCVGRAW